MPDNSQNKKKKLTLVSIEKEARDNYLKDLRSFFKDEIEICGYYVNGQELPDKFSGDLVLYTSQELIPELKKHILESSNILLLRRTIFKENIKCLSTYPVGTKAIFFDYSEQTAKQIISRITEYGIRSIVFSVAGRDTPGKRMQELIKQNELFIIAGLGSLVSVAADDFLDIGWTAIDTKTLLDISILLDCYNEKLERCLFRHMRKDINVEHGMLYYLKASLDAKNKYEMIMEMLEYGILIYDKNGKILHCNEILLSIFCVHKDNVIGANVAEVELPWPVRKELSLFQLMEEKWVSCASIKRNFTLTINEIVIFSELENYLAIIKCVDRIQKQGSRVRRQMKDQGFRAKYTFRHILGSSATIKNCKKKAIRIAETDKTVLITGESGVGKELFVNAMHNVSPRRNMPFVAINCAALTPTLLESEMFGYEPGAFTNSKSEGQIGLFESAHKGTIFLDEIGEIPLEVQAKLLRVIEEQEIRRVGGYKRVPIDVRVIAATNQNLYELCRQKQFREDLYYRLNVLPLQIPPLRDRREDILFLVQAFLKEFNMPDRKLTEKLKADLVQCRWRGNIRELFNCIQYMAYLDDGILDSKSLPSHMGPNSVHRESDEYNGGTHYLYDEAEHELIQGIFSCLRRKHMGRSELVMWLRKNGYKVSEYKVRRILEKLRNDNYLIYGVGRGGIRLTEKIGVMEGSCFSRP